MRIVFDCRDTLPNVIGRKFVVVVHCPNVGAAAGKCYMVPIRVKASMRTRLIPAIVRRCNRLNSANVLIVGVVGDDNFPRLNRLCPERS